MKAMLFTLFGFACMSKAVAQSGENLKPLILIDTLFTYNESMIVHPSKFISISTIEPKKAMQLYGSNAKFGVVQIQTRADVHLARLNSILDKFKVEERYRGLNVCIDKLLVSEPDKILADLDEIKNVEIISEQSLSAAEAPRSYINIVTMQPM
jgi:hypothetical protein